MDALAGAALYDPRYPRAPFLNGPYLDIFVSRNLDDDREKMGYVEQLYESLPLGIKLKFKLSKPDTKFEKKFSNGARIVCMHIPRGKGPAKLRVDEAAFLPDPRKVWQGVYGAVALGGYVWAVSTPLGKIGGFYDLIEPQDERTVKNWRLVRTYWWDCPGLCTNVPLARKQAPGMPTADRVEKFGTEQLKQIFHSPNFTLEDFQQEYECAFVDESQSFYPWELLLSVAKCERSAEDLPGFDRDYAMYDTFEAFAEHKRGDVFCGYDVGRTRNTAELAVFEKLGGRVFQRVVRTYDKTPFRVQKVDLRDALDVLNPVRLSIDYQGIGMDMSEGLNTDYGNIVELVTFSNPEKDRMATIAKKALEDKNAFLSTDRARLRQWHSVKQEVTPTGKFSYAPDKSEKHHADKWCADILAISRAFARESSAGFGVSIGYR